MVRMAFPLVEGGVESMHEEPDPVLAQQAIPANLKVMEGMLKSDPDNPGLLTRLAEGFCTYAFSFVEDEDPERASALYLRGKNHGLHGLAAAGDVRLPANSSLDEFSTAAVTIQAEQLPTLFWLTHCWAGWLMLNLHEPEALAGISKVEQLILRSLELDETFYYAGPHLLAGAFYGSRTKLLGGDPAKAKFHFERNLQLNGNKFLLTYVLFARTYAVNAQDRDLYEKLLNDVLAAPPDILPGQRLANEVAKRKAEKMLEMTDELF